MKLMPSDVLDGVARGNHTPPHSGDTDRPTFSIPLAIPLEWQTLADPPSDALLEGLERRNSGVLETLLKCADLGTAPIEDETLAEALKPLRLKMDLMIDMLARLSYRDQQLPAPCLIELGLSHMVWSLPTSVAPDSWLQVKLYFHDVYREPVTLVGQVKSCDPEAATGTHRIDLALAEMSESLSESFARLMFLEHRRRRAHGTERPVTGRNPA